MTKRISLLTVLSVLTCFGAFAQTTIDWSRWSTRARYPGYVIYKDAQDTVKGWVEHLGAADNQEKCIFYANQNDKKPVEKYSPENVKAYGINGRHYRSINYSGGLIAKAKRFVLLDKDGGISTYRWNDGAGKEDVVYAKIEDPNTMPHTQDYFMLKFASKMSEFVADYAELSKKIADKEKGYGTFKFFDIIDEYNKWFANGKK